MTVYILLLTYFLQGGMVLNKTVLAHDEATCEGSKPDIIKMELRTRAHLGPGEWMISDLQGQCIRVTKKVI